MEYAIEGLLITNIADKLRKHLPVNEQTERNLIKTSIDSNWSVFNNGTGWKYGYRLNSSGVEKVDDFATPQSVTGYISASYGDVFIFENVEASYGYAQHVFCYDSSFNMTSEVTPKYNNTTFVSVTITDTSCAYIRVSGQFDGTAVIEKQGENTETGENTYKLIEMPSAIDSVYAKGVEDGKSSSEFKTQSKSVTPTASSTTVTPDSGYDGLVSVTVNAVPTETKSVTANGTYTPSSGKFFSKVDVNVPASGITPSGTINIEENGTFDVTNFASAIVNVTSGGGSNCAMGEVTATASTTLTVNTGKTDATHFLLYIDDTSLSSSTVIMFTITPFVSFGLRYSGSEKKVTMFSAKGVTAYTVAGTISNGVVTCDMGNSFNFNARTYKWIAW